MMVRDWFSCEVIKSFRNFERNLRAAQVALMHAGDNAPVRREVRLKIFATFEPVSYTHLDVYKRQSSHRSKLGT